MRSINYAKEFLIGEIQGNVLRTVCETTPLTLNGCEESRPTRVFAGGEAAQFTRQRYTYLAVQEFALS